MYYVYVLRSEVDKKLYVGYTSDLRKRMKAHNNGRVSATRDRKPLELLYYEACVHRDDAIRRERYLKTTYGKRYIKNRLKHFLFHRVKRTYNFVGSREVLSTN
jgi:putative endonuclease